MQHTSNRNDRLFLGNAMSKQYVGKVKVKDDDDEDDLKKNNILCNIVATSTTTKTYNVFLNEAIGESYYYNNLLDLLHNAKEDDVINVHFNNGGGYVTTACQLIAAFLKTAAHTVGHLDAPASSAASMIFLSMSEYKISSFAEMLCHYYSSGLYGKGNEIESMSDFQKKHMRSIFNTVYEGFLSKDELEQMFEGKDFIFNGTEIKRRLDIKNLILAKKYKTIKKGLKK
jgi:ATP-dependent protease ClpP protease subunit